MIGDNGRTRAGGVVEVSAAGEDRKDDVLQRGTYEFHSDLLPDVTAGYGELYRRVCGFFPGLLLQRRALVTGKRAVK